MLKQNMAKGLGFSLPTRYTTRSSRRAGGRAEHLFVFWPQPTTTVLAASHQITLRGGQGTHQLTKPRRTVMHTATQ